MADVQHGSGDAGGVSLNLSGATVVVTGGGRWLGKAIDTAFVAAGAAVAIGGRTAEIVYHTAAELGRGARHRVRGFTVDVGDEASMDAFARGVTEEFGTVDVLVNNAGINPRYLPSEETTLAQWSEIIDVNLTGVFLACRRRPRARSTGLCLQ